MLKYYFVLIILIHFISVSAQIVIKGIVLESSEQGALAFANIGIQGQNIGTTSGVVGTFSITIPSQYTNDTLTFSHVGYHQYHLLIPKESKGGLSIVLQERKDQLEEVFVVDDAYKEVKGGIKRRNALLHFVDGMFSDTNDSYEIAQLIKQKQDASLITSVNLYLFESIGDSATFRVNFYGVKDGLPAGRLVNKDITVARPINQGWMTIDLKPYNILLKEDFVVAIEVLPDSGNKKPLQYEIKLGGKSKSFFRTSSLGKWNRPPHHYCLYVTMLVDPSTYVESKEEESKPTVQFYSEIVKDTFSINIHRPKSYDARFEYPVVYILDGNAYYDHAISIIYELDVAVEPIVIGIGYQNVYLMDSLRRRDYTFPTSNPEDGFSVSGGAPLFYQFIKEELTPMLEKSYAIKSSSNAIIGHSLAGYFVCYALLKDLAGSSSLFDTYIASSPSLWYQEEYLLKAFQNSAQVNKSDKKLLLTSGEKESLAKDQNLALSQILKSLDKLEIEVQNYSELGHMGTAIPSLQEGLKGFLLD